MYLSLCLAVCTYICMYDCMKNQSSVVGFQREWLVTCEKVCVFVWVGHSPFLYVSCTYVPHLPILSTRFFIDLQPYITVFGHLSEYLYIVQMWFTLFGSYLLIYPLFLVSGCLQCLLSRSNVVSEIRQVVIACLVRQCLHHRKSSVLVLPIHWAWNTCIHWMWYTSLYAVPVGYCCICTCKLMQL